MNRRLEYGYFRSEALALDYIKKAKRGDKGTKKNSQNPIQKRDRPKNGQKTWFAYRTEATRTEYK